MANRVVNIELHSEYCGNCAVCAGRQIGVNDERERIIKLLENSNCKPNDHDYNGGCNCDVIALIKGDN
jgi:hypothetical protein